MKFQRDRFSCGVFVVVNAARVLGVRLTQRAVRQHTSTTEDGTTEHGILNALERLGFKGTPFQTTDKEDAFDALTDHVFEGRPVILCVEEDRHWVVAVGICGDKVVTFDSWNSRRNQAEAGVEVWDARALRKWWSKREGCYYGIAVSKA